MTALTPTTTATILRGSDTDEYGDQVDTDTSVATGVDIAITETSKRVYLPSESRTTITRVFTGRVRPDVDIRTNDRVQDERASTTYLVEGVTQVQSPFEAADKRLDLRRIDT